MAGTTYSPIIEGEVLASEVYLGSKRCVDIMIAVVFLVLLSPLLIVIALLIKIDSPGPIIFRQERVGLKSGKRGEPLQLRNFTMYKFRTMRHNADSACHQQFMKAFIQNDIDTIETLQDSDATEFEPVQARQRHSNHPHRSAAAQNEP